ncbi:GDSL-type esterase/lipase family protein [Brevundimonas sp. NPDC092305]|uniref:GDSL-type esterase/lipase family protein n=1 Tax=Brevundimonas sp. NPDC092305 TaxID=3363957 RepID=UPI003802A0E8
MGIASQPALAQSLPVGMVEEPCLPPLPDLSPTATEAEIASRREAMMERRRADWGGLCRHRLSNGALGTRAVEAVFIGDSITEFWEAASPDLFRDGVVNRGIGAQTSPQMLLRFQQDVIALKPRVVHIMAGTNDVAGNSGPGRPEDFRNNIRSMVELAQAHGIGVVIGAIPPAATFSWRPGMAPAGRIRELNGWLRDYARERGAVFVDYHEAMRGLDGEMRPELTADGVHPDADGYAVMTPLALAAIQAAAAGSMPR